MAIAGQVRNKNMRLTHGQITAAILCSRTATPQRNYAHFSPVNDVALHSNQGELISCDQNGAIKIWDLGADCCSHDLVRDDTAGTQVRTSDRSPFRRSQLPEEDVPMRSVSIASDGSSLVAGNHKVC